MRNCPHISFWSLSFWISIFLSFHLVVFPSLHLFCLFVSLSFHHSDQMFDGSPLETLQSLCVHILKWQRRRSIFTFTRITRFNRITSFTRLPESPDQLKCRIHTVDYVLFSLYWRLWKRTHVSRGPCLYLIQKHLPRLGRTPPGVKNCN